MRSCSCRE